MTATARTTTRLALPLCTTLALVAHPAMAHDGSHDFTFMTRLLHDFAYADYLATGLCAAAFGATAAWRLARRKAAATKL